MAGGEWTAKNGDTCFKTYGYQQDPFIDITSPDANVTGNDGWKQGSTRYITWDYFGPEDKEYAVKAQVVLDPRSPERVLKR